MFATRQVLKHDNKGLWLTVFLGCFIQSELLYKYLQAALQCCNILMYFPDLPKSRWLSLILSVKKKGDVSLFKPACDVLSLTVGI